MLSENYDINIDNYTIDELKNMFNINNLNEITIMSAFQNYRNNNQDESLNTFINDAEQKLLKYSHQQNNTDSRFYNSESNTVMMSRNKGNSIKSFNLNSIADKSGLNPNYTNTYKRILNIDSKFRTYSFPVISTDLFQSSPEINYNDEATCQDIKKTDSTSYTAYFTDKLDNVISLQLNSYSIPYLWYNIDYKYGVNFFKFIVNDTTNSAIDIVIPKGNYQLDSLDNNIFDTINDNLLNICTNKGDTSSSSDNVNINNNFDIKFKYIKSTGKTQIRIYKMGVTTEVQKYDLDCRFVWFDKFRGDNKEFIKANNSLGFKLGFRNEINSISNSNIEMYNANSSEACLSNKLYNILRPPPTSAADPPAPYNVPYLKFESINFSPLIEKNKPIYLRRTYMTEKEIRDNSGISYYNSIYYKNENIQLYLQQISSDTDISASKFYQAQPGFNTNSNWPISTNITRIKYVSKNKKIPPLYSYQLDNKDAVLLDPLNNDNSSFQCVNYYCSDSNNKIDKSKPCDPFSTNAPCGITGQCEKVNNNIDKILSDNSELFCGKLSDSSDNISIYGLTNFQDKDSYNIALKAFDPWFYINILYGKTIYSQNDPNQSIDLSSIVITDSSSNTDSCCILNKLAGCLNNISCDLSNSGPILLDTSNVIWYQDTNDDYPYEFNMDLPISQNKKNSKYYRFILCFKEEPVYTTEPFRIIGGCTSGDTIDNINWWWNNKDPTFAGDASTNYFRNIQFHKIDNNQHRAPNIEGVRSYSDCIFKFSICNTTTIISDAPADLTLTKYLLLGIDDFQNNRINNNLVSIEPTNNYIKKQSNKLGLKINNCQQQFKTGNNYSIDASGFPKFVTKDQIYAINAIESIKQIPNFKSISPTVNIFAIIPIAKIENIKYGDTIKQEENTIATSMRKYFGPISLSSIKISLYTEDGILLDLNKNDWAVTLLCEQLYKY